MNILEVLSGYYPYFQAGVPKHVDRVTRALTADGTNTVHIVAQDIGKSTQPGIGHVQLPCYPLERFRFKRQWKYIWFEWMLSWHGPGLCRREKINVIHGHTWWHGGRQSLRLGRLCDLPVVLTLHGMTLDAFSEDNPPGWAAELKQAAHLIVQKPSAREKLVAWGFAPERISILIGPIPPPERDCRRPSEGPSVRPLFAGRFDPIKGIELLPEIAAQIRKEKLPYRLTAAGDGPCRKNVVCETERRQLADLLELPGWCDDMADLYRTHDVILGLSRTHNVSDLTLLEAMSYGLVPVVTRSKDIEYLIRDGENGIVCGNDAAAVVAGIRMAESHFRTLSRAAAETATATAGLEHLTIAHQKIFQAAVQKNR